MKKSISIALFLIASLINAQNQKSLYKISNTIKLEGDGSWDYITMDEANDRVFVSHATMVQVVDLKSRKQIGIINDTKGVHGITLAYDLNKGFTSNGKDSSTTIFDLKTLKTLSKVKVTGAKPDAILYDKFSNKVFVFNGKSNNATVIDAKTEKVIGTIALEGKPEFSVTDEKGKIFVNIETNNTIAVINTLTFKVEQSWQLTPGEEPTGLAIDNKTHRLFSVCGNKLMIVTNAENGKQIAKLPIGDHCDGVTFDNALKRIYSSNGEGTMTIIQQENEDLYKVIETFKTQKGAKTITVNSKTKHIFLPVAELGDTPKPTLAEPKPKPSIIPNTFKLIEIESAK